MTSSTSRKPPAAHIASRIPPASRNNLQSGRQKRGLVIPDVALDLRRQRHVAHLHRLGPRAMDELLREIGAKHACMTLIESLLEEYTRLDPEAVAAAGGYQFPEPLAVINGGRL